MEDTQQEMTKPQIIEALQAKGLSVNPQKKREELFAQLNGASSLSNSGQTLQQEISPTPTPSTDTDKILAAISGLANQVESVTKRVSRIEDGGKNEFKADVKQEDVESAAKLKADMDPKIVKIVEDTLGIDFGIQIGGFGDKPGLQLDIIVPKRLSGIPERNRPVKDPATGEYMIDGKTGRVVEETYWPGDKRSIALGSTGSYDMIQAHCNRIRAFIVSEYQKTSRPLPEFRIK